MHLWHIWIIAAIIFFIIEIFTPGFVLACLGIGCLVSGLAAIFNFNFQVQVLVFSITTLIVFFGIRPFILKYLFKTSATIETNVDALIGKIGRVSVKIDPASNTGRVIVEGDDWRAVSVDDNSIEAGTKVIILKVTGTKLLVKKADSEN